MVIYHGSDVIVETPNLARSRKTLDFGSGFYTTMNREQAVEFSRKVAIRNKHEKRFVSVYDFDEESAMPVLNILRFSEPDKNWLDFVHQNRSGKYKGTNFDITIGPVANDDVFTTFILFEQNILNTEQTLEALKVKKLYNQYVFKTEKALSFLKFKEAFEPEGDNEL